MLYLYIIYCIYYALYIVYCACIYIYITHIEQHTQVYLHLHCYLSSSSVKMSWGHQTSQLFYPGGAPLWTLVVQCRPLQSGQ